MSARDYWHATRATTGRTCWSSPMGWRSRICGRCAWRTVTGRNRRAASEFRARMQVILDCEHANTRPNPAATAVLDRNPRVCLDCGTGIVGRAC